MFTLLTDTGSRRKSVLPGSIGEQPVAQLLAGHVGQNVELVPKLVGLLVACGHDLNPPSRRGGRIGASCSTPAARLLKVRKRRSRPPAKEPPTVTATRTGPRPIRGVTDGWKRRRPIRCLGCSSGHGRTIAQCARNPRCSWCGPGLSGDRKSVV